MGRCAFCYMLNLFGVMVLYGSVVNRRGTSALGICAFYYMLNLFGVMVLQRSMVNWVVHLPWVYVHSSICETYSV